MKPMLVIRIQPVVIQVRRNDVRKRQPIRLRSRIPRPMKHKRDERERHTITPESPSLPQHPLPSVPLVPFVPCLCPHLLHTRRSDHAQHPQPLALLEHQPFEHTPPFAARHLPIENFLRSPATHAWPPTLTRRPGASRRRRVPHHQRPGAPNRQHLAHHTPGIPVKAHAPPVAVVQKTSKPLRAGQGGHRRPTKHQVQIFLQRPRRCPEERSPRHIRRVILITLRIQPR